MKVALRRGAASDATLIQRLASDYIRSRLVTQWPHAGFVIGDRLYHASGSVGLAVTDLTPERWDLIDMGESYDAPALAIFAHLVEQGAGYDWLELLDFTLARKTLRLFARVPRVRRWLELNVYCYFLVLWALTLVKPTARVTPEKVLWECLIRIAPTAVQPSTKGTQ